MAVSSGSSAAGKPAEMAQIGAVQTSVPDMVESDEYLEEASFHQKVFLAAVTGLLAANRSDHRKGDGSLNVDKVIAEAMAVADATP